LSHFAKLDENNIVTFVTVGRQEDDGQEAALTARTGDVYKQTSYNTSGGVHRLGGTPLRKNYAGIGYTYDAGVMRLSTHALTLLGCSMRTPACGMLQYHTQPMSAQKKILRDTHGMRPQPLGLR
jgi:hypothetical protein